MNTAAKAHVEAHKSIPTRILNIQILQIISQNYDNLFDLHVH